jgi:hypothetical protein
VQDAINQMLGRDPEQHRPPRLSWQGLLAALAGEGIQATEQDLIDTPLRLDLSDEVKPRSAKTENRARVRPLGSRYPAAAGVLLPLRPSSEQQSAPKLPRRRPSGSPRRAGGYSVSINARASGRWGRAPDFCGRDSRAAGGSRRRAQPRA